MGDGPLTAYPRDALLGRPEDIARRLLGALVVSDLPPGRVAVRLTEVEAYAGEQDPGSHAYRGRTPRTEVMFGDPGHVYVYFSYGMHWCANVVCGPSGIASAVLLRAGEVVEGVEVAHTRRPTARSERDLARGPARLCAALAVTGALDGSDLLAGGPLSLLEGATVPRSAVQRGPRVGVGGEGAATPWRFWVRGAPTVSVYRPHAPRGRARRTPAEESGT